MNRLSFSAFIGVAAVVLLAYVAWAEPESKQDRPAAAARRAAADLATTTGEQRNSALAAAAAALRTHAASIIEANSRDMGAARERGLSVAMLDRLMLDDDRVEAMAAGLETIITLHDPVGRVLEEWERPNGLRIQRVAVPLGVIGIIYTVMGGIKAVIWTDVLQFIFLIGGFAVAVTMCIRLVDGGAMGGE